MSVITPTVDEIVTVLGGWDGHKPLRRTPLGATPAAAVTADLQTSVANDITALCGFAVAETTGAAIAQFRLWDGNSDESDLGLRVNLNANESAREFWYPRGIEILTGRIWLEVITGSVEGVLFWR